MKKYSIVSGEQFDRYLADADRIVDEMKRIAQREGFSPFSGAIAGVLLARAVNQQMGGDIRWWASLLTCDDLVAFIGSIRVSVGAPPNIPRGGGST